MIVALALLIGVVAGLRAMTAPAVVAWAAWLGIVVVAATPLAWLAHPVTVGVFTVFALGELVGDQLPRTPSRKVPLQFATRVLTGALAGAALTVASAGWIIGALAGAIGAVAGTLGGAAARARLAAAFGRDLPAALIEDAVAVAAACLIVLAAR